MADAARLGGDVHRSIELIRITLSRIDAAFQKTIEIMLAVVLLGMVGLVFVQVVLRNFFDSGISWADVAGRHLVLWVAFLGALLATRSRQHIGIDLIARLIPRKGRNILRFVLDIVSCAVCVLLSIAAVKLVADERAMETVLMPHVKLWIVQLIIPIGFIMMTIEYAVGVVLDVLRYLYNGVMYHIASERRPL